MTKVTFYGSPAWVGAIQSPTICEYWDSDPAQLNWDRSLLNMVDRLLLFDNGRLVADGPRDKVLAILQGKPVGPAPAPLQENTIQPKSA